MDIKQVIGKIKGMVGPSSENTPKEKISSTEVELRSFKERERQDNMKKELADYRKKDFNEFMGGDMLKPQNSIIDSSNVFKGKSIFEVNKKRPEQTNMLKSNNVFNKKEKKGGNSLFFQ